ncbi:hypothetical protein [Pseudodesulfovibrio indicus]|uniref:Uncharacterized protein n=1 Tax=Pseudodesulfovibrio indicus TaxID=1716143 RepID=A0A126QJ01_9BACT|nr:hypothetical protein [Pseudodesulfovibrio indicus]AMK09964.1 hypothetical protein AWY79_01960 [Pseudodesulfovibrio indicus]TDT87351.1 hypothetical protein EDC59_10816 [Pseudodesulfovibrio indicus]
MVLEYEFLGRDKLVKGFTYPIKRGDLDAALERAGVTEVEYVSYTCCTGKSDKKLIVDAYMTGEAFHPGSWHKKSPSIGVYAVKIVVSQRIKQLLAEQDVLDEFTRWLKELEGAENVRRDQRQYYKVFFAEDALVIEHTQATGGARPPARFMSCRECSGR